MTTSSDPGSTPAPADAGGDKLDAAGLRPVEREAYEWIARFMSGDMSSAEVEALKAWYRRSPDHARAYAEARRVWQSLGPVARAGLNPAAETAIRPRRERAASLPSRRYFIGGAMAASAAWLVIRPPLAIWPSYAELTASFRTGTGERRTVTVAERYALELNTRTSIALRSPETDGAQVELLSGEAAMSARGGPPLTVIARAGRISSADGDFNVRCDDSEVAISCLRGQVSVQQGGAVTMLSERQQISYGGGASHAVATIDPDVVTAWQRGLLIFESTPVAKVVAEVNRYRPGRIVLLNDEIGRRLLSAQLRVAEVDRIVVQIVHIFGATARELPGGITVLT